MPEIERKLDEVARQLRDAKRVLFITGAGISADSGLPTYRGVGGLYENERTEEGYPIETCLSASMFSIRPEITWKYMLTIGEAVGRCKPNAAHEILARWERDIEKRRGKLVILTQNIDGYHRQAGSKNVLEIHGSFNELYCNGCEWKTTVGLDDWNHKRLEKHLAEFRFPPKCPWCNEVIRPRIVLFEEMLPRNVLNEFDIEFQDGTGFDMIFSVGTSAMFPYITGPVREAARKRKTTIEINPVAGDLSKHVAFHLPLRAAEAMTLLDKRLQ